MNWAHLKDPVSHVSCWYSGSILVSYTRGVPVTGSSPFTVMKIIFLSLNSLNSVKTFRNNSIASVSLSYQIDPKSEFTTRIAPEEIIHKDLCE